MTSEKAVLLIVGEGRSGSTLIEEVLSQINGAVGVGELQFIWKRGYFDNQLCGCGVPIRECTFWNEIFSEVIRIHDVNAYGNKFMYTKYDSFSAFPSEILKNYLGLSEDLHRKYFSVISYIYGLVLQKTKAQVIVDSSKFVHYAYFLLRYCELDVRVLHLVRDPRGVAFSRDRKKYRAELIGRKEYMPRMGFVKSAIRWHLVTNMCKIVRIHPSSTMYRHSG